MPAKKRSSKNAKNNFKVPTHLKGKKPVKMHAIRPRQRRQAGGIEPHEALCDHTSPYFEKLTKSDFLTPISKVLLDYPLKLLPPDKQDQVLPSLAQGLAHWAVEKNFDLRYILTLPMRLVNKSKSIQNIEEIGKSKNFNPAELMPQINALRQKYPSGSWAAARDDEIHSIVKAVVSRPHLLDKTSRIGLFTSVIWSLDFAELMKYIEHFSKQELCKLDAILKTGKFRIVVWG